MIPGFTEQVTALKFLKFQRASLLTVNHSGPEVGNRGDLPDARFSTARVKRRRIPRLLRIADRPGIAAVCRARADPDAVPRRYALLGWASGRRSLKDIAEQWL
jgi:hypothetical protein